MKKLLICFLLGLLYLSGDAQVLRPNQLPTTNAPARFDITGYQLDSAFLSVIRSTFPSKYPALIRKTVDSAFWYTNGGWAGAPWWKLIDEKDTASMLGNLLKVSDTLTMLSNYPTTAGWGLKKSSKVLSVDSTSGYLATWALLKKKIDSLGGLKLNISDTAAMETPYHASFYTASFDTSSRILTLTPITGGSPTLITIPRGGAVNGMSSIVPARNSGSNVQFLLADNGDTFGFSLNTIDSLTKVHYSDTAGIVNGYVRTIGITTANGVSASSSGGQNPLLTVMLGAITPTSVSSSGAITGTTLGGALAKTLTFGTHLTSSGSSFNNSANVTILTDGTASNIANTIMVRDVNGDFQGSAATLSAVSVSSTLQATGIVTFSSISGTGTMLVTANANGALGRSSIDPASLGTVTSVSVSTANGVSGSVATATTTPAITLTLGAITPTSVSASGSITATTLAGTLQTAAQPNITSLGVLGNLTVTNTISGSISGNANTSTSWATPISLALTGDITGSFASVNGSGSVSAATTLATVNSNVGSFTNASITVNAKGLITAASSGTAVTQYWQRTSTVLSPATTGDVVQVSDGTFISGLNLGSVNAGTTTNQTSLGSDRHTFVQNSSLQLDVKVRNLTSGTKTVYLQNKNYTLADSADVAANSLWKDSSGYLAPATGYGGRGIYTNGLLTLGNSFTKASGAVADANILGFQAAFQTNSSSGFKLANYNYAEQTVATTGSIQALEGQSFMTHTSGTVALALGTIGNLEIAGSGGTTSRGASGQFGGRITAGTITQWDGLYSTVTQTGGTLTTWSAFRAAATIGTIATKYSFYGETGAGDLFINDNATVTGTITSGAISTTSSASINGAVGIGVTAPSSAEMLKVKQTNGDNSAILVTTAVASGHSYGPTFQAGTTSGDRAFYVADQTGGTAYLQVRGDGQMSFISTLNGSATLTAGVLSAVSDSITKVDNGVFKEDALATVMKIPLGHSWQFADSTKSGMPLRAQKIKQFGWFANQVFRVLGEEFAPSQGQSKEDSAMGIIKHGLNLGAIQALSLQAFQQKKIQDDNRFAALEARMLAAESKLVDQQIQITQLKAVLTKNKIQ